MPGAVLSDGRLHARVPFAVLPRRQRSRFLPVPIDRAWEDFWVHAGGITAVGFIRLVDDSGLLTLGLGGLICCLVYGFLAIRESRTADHKVTLLSWLFALSVLNSGLSAVYLAFYLIDQGYLPFVTIALGPPSLASGYLIFLVGQVFFHLGYLARARKKLLWVQTLLAQSGRQPGRVGPVVFFWLLGIASTLFPDVVKGSLGSIGGTFERAQLASLAFLALRGPENFGIRRSTWWALLTVGSLGNFLVSLTQNSKSLVVLSLLPLFWYLMKESWKKFTVFASVVMVLYALVIHPVVTIARERNQWQGIEYAWYLVDTYEQSGGVSGMMEKFGGPFQSVHDMLMRPFQATVIGFVFEESDRAGFRYGETLEGSWFAFVPRFLWPDKPNVTRGGVWREYISGVMGGGGIALSAPGEMYWNWGVLGVALGMALIGVMYGELVKMTGDPLGSQIRMLLHLNLVLGVGELTDVLSTIVGLTVAFGLFAVLIPVSERLIARRHAIGALVTGRLPAGSAAGPGRGQGKVEGAEPAGGKEDPAFAALLLLARRRELPQLVAPAESPRRTLAEALSLVSVLALRSRTSLQAAWIQSRAGKRFGGRFPDRAELGSLLTWLGRRRAAVLSEIRRRHAGEASPTRLAGRALFTSVKAEADLPAIDVVFGVDGSPLWTAPVRSTGLDRLTWHKRAVSAMRSLELETTISLGPQVPVSGSFIRPLQGSEKQTVLARFGVPMPGAEPTDLSQASSGAPRYVLYRQEPFFRLGAVSLEERMFQAEKSLRSLELKYRQRRGFWDERAMSREVSRVLSRFDVSRVLSVRQEGLEIVVERHLDEMASEAALETTGLAATSEPAGALSAQDVARACRLELAAGQLGSILAASLQPDGESWTEQEGFSILMLVALHVYRWSEPDLR